MLRQKQKLPGKAIFKKQNTPFFCNINIQLALGLTHRSPNLCCDNLMTPCFGTPPQQK